MAKGDPSPEARALIDSWLEREPESWRTGGDLHAEAFEQALKGFWLGHYMKASVRRGAELPKAELGHAEASPAGRVLIEHAVVCHLRLGMVEHLYEPGVRIPRQSAPARAAVRTD